MPPLRFGRGKLALGLAVLSTVLTACDSKDSAQLRAGIALERQIAQIAGQANGAAPAVIDPNTRLDGAKAGPGLKLTIMYTLTNAGSNGVNSATFEASLAPTVTDNSCANADLRPLIDQGVVVVLEYRGAQGDPIGSVSVNPGTCGALTNSGAGTVQSAH